MNANEELIQIVKTKLYTMSIVSFEKHRKSLEIIEKVRSRNMTEIFKSEFNMSKLAVVLQY